MIYAVNLLPEACRDRRRRTVRRSGWIGSISALVILVAGSWIGLRSINRVAAQYENDLDYVTIKQSELERQLITSAIQRNELARRAEALAALRRNQSSGYLPSQLYELSLLAPENVVLTEIRSLPTNFTSRPPDRTQNESSGIPGLDLPGKQVNDASALITGFSADHHELMLLIDALKKTAHWEQVEIIRTAREPYKSIMALSFRLECRQMENAK